MAPSSKMSTISNAKVAAVTAQYTQEYRTPYRPTIPCLSTRLRMKATIPPPPVAVNDPSPHSTLGGARPLLLSLVAVVAAVGEFTVGWDALRGHERCPGPGGEPLRGGPA